MALTLKRKPLVAFVLLELFEDGNDGFKRGKTKLWLRERVEQRVFKERHPCLEDDENERGSICINFKRY